MPTATNSINEATTGICGFTGTAFTATAATQHAIQVGGSTTSTLTSISVGSTGQVLQANTTADPTFSTATYPSIAGTSGKILISDGTNIISSTPTYPNVASTALKHIKSDGTNFVTTTVTYPDASVTAGKVIISDGTNYIASTPTFPNASATTRKIIVSDGTNWVASTETYAVPGTSGNILTSNGTNWTSAAPATSGTVTSVSGTANQVAVATGTTTPVISLIGPYTPATYTAHGVLIGEGTSSIVALAAGSAGQVLQSGGASADPAYSTATFPATATGTGTLLRADGTNWVATTSTYPNTNAVSTLLYASATNVMSALATANNSVVLTNATGVPSLGISLINDFTYTSSTAATVRTLTVTNTDNTNTASGALIQAVSGGASAGDAVFQASTTTTVWSFGVDNSVTSPTADPFVISQGTALGTNNIMSVATSGEINYPLQSAFLAIAGTQADVTGDGTVYTATYATEIFDQNSDFDGTSTFTSPVTGRYYLSVTTAITDLTASHVSGAWSITTSNRAYRYAGCSWGANRTGSTNNNTASGSALCDMDAADTAISVVIVGGGTKVVDVVNVSTFSGFLAC